MDTDLEALFRDLTARIERNPLLAGFNLPAIAQPSVRLVTQRAPYGRIGIGGSRIGGTPDVPPGFEWPLWVPPKERNDMAGGRHVGSDHRIALGWELRTVAMEKHEVEVFSGAVNSVVLRTPGRRFPGLLIQGDTFASLYSIARKIRDLVPASSDGELRDLVEELEEELASRLQDYENVLRSHAIDLPYVSPFAVQQ
jgi:hypothetical protein